jgi:putative NIF3 family GTP cyclohydrolase 1 type 2
VNLSQIAEQLGLKSLTPQISSRNSGDISGGHVSDLLSDVLANAPSKGVLVTIQVHMNVIAVAVHADLSAVIFASGKTPEEAVVRKAVEEKIPLYVAKEPAFDIVGRLYSLGLRGPRA